MSPLPAVPAHECPGALESYSSGSSLADLAAEPQALAVLERLAPGLLQAPAAFGGGPLPLGILRVFTPRTRLEHQGQDGAAVLAQLDAALAAIPPSDEALRQRCARYDAVAPELPAQLPRPALLVFDKINGFRDEASVNGARDAVTVMARRRGWSLVFSDNGAVFNAQDLARFDAVFWNNVSGDALTLPQRAAMRAWVEAGGGFAAVHGSAGDPVCRWDWYADTLLGVRFAGHPMAPVLQQGLVRVEPGHAIVDGLGEGWDMLEEWYSFTASPRLTGAQVLLTLDEASYDPVGLVGRDLRMGDHPLAWVRRVGRGRSFYSAIGHRAESYQHPESMRVLERGLAWTMGLAP